MPAQPPVTAQPPAAVQPQSSKFQAKDNQKYDKADIAQAIPTIVQQIADKTLGDLQQEGLFIFPERVTAKKKEQDISESEDLESDQMVLCSQKGQYVTGNVMGFLGCHTEQGTEQLTISSRFTVGEQDGQEGLYMLQYLLGRVLNFPNILNLDTEGDPGKRVLDLLTFLFPGYLKKAMRKGLFKMYRRVQYNDANPRGTIDVARHIKQNVPFMGKIAYNQREYSYDNYLMELVRHTIELIKGKPYGKQVLKMAKDEVRAVVEATPGYRRHDRQRVLADNLNHTVRHAFYHEYRELQKLCIMILQHQKQGMGGDQQRVFGILFDGAWLWEEYVNSLVKEWFYHPRNKGGEGKHYLFRGNTNYPSGDIYPDFIGRRLPIVVADAKYKPIDNINREDRFQILAYMLRFDARKGLFFYPKSKGEPNGATVLHLLQGTQYHDGRETQRNPEEDIIVYKLGFVVPDEVGDYESFCQCMIEQEKEFKIKLCAILA